jgi:hypothetical protein
VHSFQWRISAWSSSPRVIAFRLHAQRSGGRSRLHGLNRGDRRGTRAVDVELHSREPRTRNAADASSPARRAPPRRWRVCEGRWLEAFIHPDELPENNKGLQSRNSDRNFVSDCVPSPSCRRRVLLAPFQPRLVNWFVKVTGDSCFQRARTRVVIGIGRYQDRRYREPALNEVCV